MSKSQEDIIYETMGRKKRGKRHPDTFEPYDSIYDDYYAIYYDYLLNIVMSEFKYDNVPVTFNEKGLEWLLRTVGYANLIAFDKDNVIVEGIGYDTPGINLEFGSILGGLSVGNKSDTVAKMLNGKKATSLTRLNSKKAELPVVVTLSNKGNYYNGGMISDMLLIDRTAKTLAEIKASSIMNIRQQKTPFIGFTRDNSLTAKSIWAQLQSGRSFISIDSDVAEGDIKNIIQTIPTQTPNLAPTLKDSWNDCMNEFLTFIGLDAVAVDKKERLVTSEAESNDQQVSISATSYLDARNMQLDLLNDCLGTNIKARMNFDTLEDTLDILNNERPDDNNDQLQNDNDNSDNEAE